MIFSYYEGENTNAQNIYMNRRKFKQLSDEEKRYLYVVHREGTANIPENVHRKYSKGLYSFFFEG